jgi:hypothetical protein
MSTFVRKIQTLWEPGAAAKQRTSALADQARALPDQLLFWTGALLLSSGALSVEALDE